METTRRSFVKSASLLLSGCALLPELLAAAKNKNSIMIGIQLYTVRDDMKVDPAGTLKKIKSYGYTHVEHAGYENRKFYGYSPEAFQKLLNDLGLKMESGHSFLGANAWDKTKNDISDEWKYTIEDAVKVGMKYVISPGVDEDACKNIDDFEQYMDLFNKMGAVCRKSGITFAYHNEAYEFNHRLDNTVLYDLLLDKTDPSLVAQQIDIGNMYAPGGRAMDYLKRYPGRFPLMHVKDVVKKVSGDGYEPAPLGEGAVGVKDIIDYARKSGTKYFIIEENRYANKTALECAKANLIKMEQWGY